MNSNYNKNEVTSLQENIKRGSALYYLRATPFTEHGEFNYNGKLSEDFFFENLFSSVGNCKDYVTRIQKSLYTRNHKSILLTGNQGCGKSTFLHYLSRITPNIQFEFFDFDKNTSHPTLEEYIEIFSNYLLRLFQSNDNVNKLFYNLYECNKDLICTKINAENNIERFFATFKKAFITSKSQDNSLGNFINLITDLFFNQILSLIILWHICRIKEETYLHNFSNKITPLVFCLDNLDVLVNKDIIEKFFKEYFRFVRNVDSIIQHIDDDFIKEQNYNSLFSFVFCCRQHTWARVKQYYPHDHGFIQISTLMLNITNSFDKKKDTCKTRKLY